LDRILVGNLFSDRVNHDLATDISLQSFQLIQGRTGLDRGVRSSKATFDQPSRFRTGLLLGGKRLEGEAASLDIGLQLGLVGFGVAFHDEPGVGSGHKDLADTFLLFDGRTGRSINTSAASGCLQNIDHYGFGGRLDVGRCLLRPAKWQSPSKQSRYRSDAEQLFFHVCFLIQMRLMQLAHL
jgi:hypothetical protein